MEKYIKADKLLKEMHNRAFASDEKDISWIGRDWWMRYTAIVHVVEAMPPADVVDKDLYNKLLNDAMIIAKSLNKYQTTEMAEVVPWEFLERYANEFSGWRSHADFVRTAKLIWEKENGEREETEDAGD